MRGMKLQAALAEHALVKAMERGDEDRVAEALDRKRTVEDAGGTVALGDAPEPLVVRTIGPSLRGRVVLFTRGSGRVKFRSRPR